MIEKLDISKSLFLYPEENIYFKDKGIFFNNVNFNLENLIYQEINILFKYTLNIENHTIIFLVDNEINNIEFLNCHFNCDFKIITYSENVNISLIDCQINSNLLFNDSKIKDLRISNSEFNSNFDLSEVIILGYIRFGAVVFNKAITLITFSTDENKTKFYEGISFFRCIFNDEFDLYLIDTRKNKNLFVKDLTISFFQSIFNKKCLFSESNFSNIKINFKNTIFNNIVYFNNTVFSNVSFYNAQFNENTIFRDSVFLNKLDFRYTIFAKEVNFLDISSKIREKDDKKVFLKDSSLVDVANRETARIIKQSFEKLNNKIEANKYHALELVQRKKELEKDKWKYFSEYLVFIIHDLSSKHSTSWFRAVLWIIFVGFFTIFLVHFDIVKDLFFHPSNFKIEYLSKIWSEFWQYINITNLERLKDKPFIFFLNKLSLGYLYYQFLTAVRKDTRK